MNDFGSLYRLNPLTPRELDILRMIADGFSNQNIAEKLYLELSTVKWYNKQIYSKLAVRSRTHAVAQAQALGLLQASAPSRVERHNLPVPTTVFVGREAILNHIQDLLGMPAHRLLTLVGAPGIGKTRLGLKAAERLLDTFTDGVYFVPLAPITDPALVISAIADALGLQRRSEPHSVEIVKQYLRPRCCLLLLDNFEHLLVSAPVVADLLAAAPDLKVLATSREPLQLYGEQELVVPSLSLPNLRKDRGREAIARHEAIRLFVQHAQAVKANFQITDENASTIAEICVRLDGLPLAIELAAARVKLYSPETLLDRLSKRLSITTGGARDLPARHQTLRAALEWSYALLSTSEKVLLSRLGVFVGGFTLDAVDAVCGVERSITVFDTLETLLNKSLIQPVEGADGEPRFMLLETIREYALEKLAESTEDEVIRQRHAAYFLALAERAEPQLRGADQLRWWSRLDEDYANLRAVLAYYLAQGKTESLQVLGGYLVTFWHHRGHIVEGRRWLEAASGADSRVATTVRLKALEALFSLTWAQGDYVASQKYAEIYLALAQEMNDNKLISEALYYLGGVALAQGDYRNARKHYEESQALDAAPKKPWSTSFALTGIGEVAYLEGDYKAARRYYEQDLRLARDIQSPQAISAALNGLAKVADMQGDYNAAQTYARESLQQAEGVANQQGIAIALNRLGRIERQLGHYAQAVQYHERSLQIARALNNQPIIAFTLNKLGEVAADQGDYATALTLHTESLILHREMDDPYYVADTLYYLAVVSLEQNLLTEAAQTMREALQIAWRISARMILLQALACFAQLFAATGRFEASVELLSFLFASAGLPASVAHRLEPIRREVEGTLSSEALALARESGQALQLAPLVRKLLEEAPQA